MMHSAPLPVQLVWVLASLSNLFFYCSELPLIHLAEQKICQRYPNQDCQSPTVQDQVATFIGLRTAFDAIPPLLVSLWYGSKLQPKTVITLACTGELFNLVWIILVAGCNYFQDIRLAWLAAFFLFIGGGQFLLYAMFTLLMVHATHPQHRARNLAILHSITLVSSLIGAPLSGLLMKKSLNLAFAWVILLGLTRYPLIWSLQDAGAGTADGCVGSEAISSEETEVLIAANVTVQAPPIVGIWSQAMALLHIPALAFSFLCFLLKRIAFTSEVLMYQTVAERSHQPLEDTAWVRIPIGFGAVFTLYVVLPPGLRRLRQASSRHFVAEAWVVRINLTVLVIGFASFWICRNFWGILIALTFCGAGEGLAPTLQTLASTITHRNHHGTLFAVISIIDTVAKFIGGPIMASMFSVRDLEGRSYGYCFLLSSFLFALLLGLSFPVPLPEPA